MTGSLIIIYRHSQVDDLLHDLKPYIFMIYFLLTKNTNDKSSGIPWIFNISCIDKEKSSSVLPNHHCINCHDSEHIIPFALHLDSPLGMLQATDICIDFG